MENHGPWHFQSRYLTKRWEKMQYTSSGASHTDQSQILGNQRYGREGRNHSLAGMSSACSFGRKFQIQQLCLEDNKWIIIDEGLEEKKEVVRPFTKMSSYRDNLRCSGKKNGLPVVSKIAKSQLLSGQEIRHKFYTRKENRNPADAQGEKLKSLLSPTGRKDGEKGKLKKIIFEKKKSNRNNKIKTEFKEAEEGVLAMTINIDVVKSPEKSTRSIRCQKSSRSLRPPKLTSKSKKSVSSVKKSPTKEAKTSQRTADKANQPQKVQKLSEISQDQVQPVHENNFQVLASLLDPVQLLNPAFHLRSLMNDPYDSFQWSKRQLPEPPALQPTFQMSEKLPEPVLEKQEMKQSLLQVYQRKSELPIDQSISNMLSVKKQEKGELRSKTTSFMEQLKESQGKRCCSLLATVDHAQMFQLQEKGRCVTTIETEKPLDSGCSDHKQLCIFDGQIITQQPGRQTKDLYVQQKSLPRVLQDYDHDFDIRRQFQAFPGISIIEIRINNQTAYFPSSKTPIYIVPNPSTFSVFKNNQIINILNLLLKVQQKTVKQMFDLQNRESYKCSLYVNGMREGIILDGFFPFDANYYPLFGSVEQYIWFAVFMKAIAKLKGSYSALGELNFIEIFRLITNVNLIQVKDRVMKAKKPPQFLAGMVKQSIEKGELILVTEGDSIYKLQAVSYVKSQEEKREQQEQKVLKRSGKLARSRGSEGNMKSLTNFIRQKKDQICLQRLTEGTVIKLVGVNQSKSVTFSQLMTVSFGLWSSITILQGVLRSDSVVRI